MSESDKIRDFFKSKVIIGDELLDVLKFKPETIIGIDNISSDKLIANGLKTIEDLANSDLDKPIPIEGILPQIMKKWIKVAKIIQKAVKEQIRDKKKLLMIGLDNGGKTSILAVVQDKFSIIKDLLPTRGVQREKLDFFGYPIISWDLGGQVQYRENMYFTKPELFFSEVDLILYVIDMQTPDRFTESANYFRQVLKSLAGLNENPPIVIVLNKADQDFRKTLQFQKNMAAIKNKFDLISSEFNNFEADYCDTTIFQKETIMTMFSTALKKVSETSEIIEHILEEFVTSVKGRALSLISMDGLIFGSFTKNDIDEMCLNNTALLMQTLLNFHGSIGFKRERDITLELPSNGITIKGSKLFDYSDLKIPVYLWLMSSEPELFEEKLDYFKEQLLPLINLFL